MPTTLAIAILVAAAARPQAGAKAPSFSLESSKGNKIALDDYKGRTVVLAFFPKAFTKG